MSAEGFSVPRSSGHFVGGGLDLVTVGPFDWSGSPVPMPSMFANIAPMCL